MSGFFCGRLQVRIVRTHAVQRHRGAVFGRARSLTLSNPVTDEHQKAHTNQESNEAFRDWSESTETKNRPGLFGC